jgi:protein TonB
VAIHRISFVDYTQGAATRKLAAPLRQLQKVQNDVFLNALLEMPTTKHTRRSPLEWAGAVGLHIVILAVLIIVPLYSTGTIHLSEHDVIPLAVPSPPAPPPPPPGGAVAPHAAHPRARMTYTLRRLAAPSTIPKKISQENGDAAPPDLSAVVGGVPGGVVGGQIGGVVGGVIRGTGPSAPTPTPSPRPAQRIVRVGSSLKAPRQTRSVDPEYPELARQVHVSGTVVVEAVIDERGNVVQARVVSGHPLLVASALKAVLQWKYEPTSLNGQPVSVELQVQVHFNLKP